MLKRLSLTNFRSYKTFSIEFSSPLVIIVGPNAVGKTNLLESIFTLSTSKSFRAHDHELVSFDESFFKLQANYDDHGVELRFTNEPTTHHKQAFVNEVKKPVRHLLGMNPVTLFEPNDLLLLTTSPTIRRHYLDLVLMQIDRDYIQALHYYRRILKQRNSLLHNIKMNRSSHDVRDHLFVWDLQLAGPATHLLSKRAKFLIELQSHLNDYYQQIAQTKTSFLLYYEPSGTANSDQFLAELTDAHDRDLAAGFTTTGPHRDDFHIKQDNHDVITIVSRGEMRTLILALKLAEMDVIEQYTGKRPLLLLDDVFSELDAERRKFLLNTIQQQQTFITTTDIDIQPESAQIIDLSGVAHG